MRISPKIYHILIAATLALSGGACGDSDEPAPPASFRVVPEGPTVVRKGETLQFNTDPAGLPVVWSVVEGEANGSIGAGSGLYSPPSVLPVDPQITVRSELDGSSATALVDLRTGETLAFGAEEPLSDTTILGLNVGGVHDFIAAQEGSLQVDAAWLFDDGVASGADIMFTQSFDLAPFGPERNLTDDIDTNRRLESVATGPDLNPGILFSAGPPFNVLFWGSTDGGASFGAPVPVDPGPDSQQNADLAIDGQAGLHVVYVHDFFQVRYAQSTDGGATWTDPALELTDDLDARCSTGLAVSEDGLTVHLCYSEGGCGSGTGFAEGDIIVATSTDGGQTFPVKVTVPDSSNSATCRVARGPGEEVYVSYMKGEDVFLAKSLNRGNSFQGGTKANTDAINSSRPLSPYMSVDSLGNIDMVWSADPNAEGNGNVHLDSLRYARSVNGGTSFSPDVEIANAGDATFIRALGLVHDISGRLHLQYMSNREDSDPTMSPFEVDVYYLRAE